MNGRYSLDRSSVLAIEGRPVVFAEGSACMDNSCCGALELRYLIVFGERADPSGDEWLKPIAPADFARRVEIALSKFTGVDTVNYYVAPGGTGQ